MGCDMAHRMVELMYLSAFRSNLKEERQTWQSLNTLQHGG